MSETERKLEDTKTQLRLAEQNINEPSAFRSCINAFISNGRSVTAVMQKEFAKAEGFKEWYKPKQDELRSNPVARFFKDQRDVSIHQKTISPNQRKLPIEEIRGGNQVIKNTGVVIAHEFADYKKLVPEDSGNVLRLCHEYLRILEDLVLQCLEKYSG